MNRSIDESMIERTNFELFRSKRKTFEFENDRSIIIKSLIDEIPRDIIVDSIYSWLRYPLI